MKTETVIREILLDLEDIQDWTNKQIRQIKNGHHDNDEIDTLVEYYRYIRKVKCSTG